MLLFDNFLCGKHPDEGEMRIFRFFHGVNVVPALLESTATISPTFSFKQ
jgi:hypothetical protein